MKTAAAVTLLILGALSINAAELVRGVRSKISAGDLATGIAQVEDYKREHGVDAEYLDAVGWLARGALLLQQPELARTYVAELRREISEEKTDLVVPYGAAIEVEGKLIAATQGRGAAIRYFQDQLARAKAPALASRISKNINLMSLEGQPAPPIEKMQRGKPALLYFFAAGCGDCKAQAPTMVRLWQKYRSKPIQVIAVTRLYGGENEKTEIEKAWKETYAGMEDVPYVIDTDAMIRYGASATPTFALVDRKGVVRLYTPTRLSEAELSRRIDELLAE